MKALAILLTGLAVVAIITTFGLTYAAIFAHDDDLGFAAYVTLTLGGALGLGAGIAWSEATS